MRAWRKLLGNESGVAMIMALMVLLALTGLVLSFLSVSSFEPQISKNLSDTARARYLAESGIETGYTTLVSMGRFTNALTGATATATTGTGGTVIGGPWVSLLATSTMPGLTGAAATAAGTYRVLVRNDSLTTDAALTGQLAGADAIPAETPTTDNNNIVIMRSTGVFNGASRTIEVVVKRAPLPPFPGAVNLPGLQTDTFVNKDIIDIDGRNYSCSTSCDTAANWTEPATDVANKYGIATNAGTQSNLGISYETNIQNALNDAAKLASVKGRSETGNATTLATGTATVKALTTSDPTALTPAKMADYLKAVKSYSGTTVLQSTQACPMKLTGAATGAPTNTVTLTNGTATGCGMNQTLDLGTRTDPRMVYFRGDQDPTSAFTGLTLDRGIKGAGILVIEDGDLKNLGNFTWDGIVIVTGAYVGVGFMDGSTTNIRGALVANETQAGEAAGYFEFFVDDLVTGMSIRNSQQNIDMTQFMKGNSTMTNWREM